MKGLTVTTISTMKSLLIFCFSLLFLSTSLLAQKTKIKDLPMFIKAKEDKAKYYHYKGIKYAREGKTKKAIKNLNQAIAIDKRNEYLIDLANLYARIDKTQEAYNVIKKIMPKDNDSEVLKVEMEAWKAYYGLSLGEISGPLKGFQSAIQLMNTHKVDSVSLMSNLYNNAGVARIYNQTKPGKGKETEMHRNDFLQAKSFFENALKFNAENCVAKYNLEIVSNLILSIPKDSIKTTVQNIKNSLYAGKEFPILDCKVPAPPPHNDILKKLNKEKQVMLVLDVSGSMAAPCPNGKSRFENMRELALNLVNDLDSAVQVGMISLGGDCSTVPSHYFPVGTASRATLKAAINELYLDGGTPLNDRLHRAAQMFLKGKEEKAIFLCSDGINSCGSESTCAIAAELRAKNIKVHAFSLLLENSEFAREYSIYDCITKSTYGELLGITETEQVEVKTDYISESVFPLALTKEDLIAGHYTPKVPQEEVLQQIPTDTKSTVSVK